MLKWTGGDLNPRPLECKTFSASAWENYRQWLLKTHEDSHAKSTFLYSKRYADVLMNPSSASRLLLLSKDMRRTVMSSLSNLSKFMGIYDQWKQIIAKYSLKWENTNNLETFLSILNTDFKETETWLRKVIKALPRDYATILIFDYLTGLRPTESALSCNLITELTEKDMLDTYLDKDLMMLQHFKFPSLFLRKSKNAYISFITPELLALVQETKPRIKYSGLDTRIGRAGFNNQTKQLRKIFATRARNSLPQEIVDLLQGRISQSVFMKFYYKPLLLDTQKKIVDVLQLIQTELISQLN